MQQVTTDQVSSSKRWNARKPEYPRVKTRLQFQLVTYIKSLGGHDATIIVLALGIPWSFGQLPYHQEYLSSLL